MTKRSCLFLVLVICALILTAAPVLAETRPIQISLVTPIQIFPERYSITGLRLNLLYGSNVSVTGLDVGLVNHTTAGKFIGLQYGLVGLSDSDFSGWQDCVVNITNKKFEGFQFGWVNYADYMSGFQLGLVNYAKTAKGLQIGLVNIIRQGGQFPVFPIVNWSF
jgi:hypothetical protein